MSTESETLGTESSFNQKPKLGENLESGEVLPSGEPKPQATDQKEILKALEVMERESASIADSFTSLFSSLRTSLSEVTARSVDHMYCFSDAAARLQECIQPLMQQSKEIRTSIPALVKYREEREEKGRKFATVYETVNLCKTEKIFMQ